MNEFSTILKNEMSSIGISLNESQIDAFKAFFEDLVEKNKVMNLTAITDMHEVINKHYVDSVMTWKLISDYAARVNAQAAEDRKISICDIGTGAGFPGIPLAIVFPDIEFVLIDSLNKRINFINEEVHKLGINNVIGVHGRTEDLAHDEAYREAFDIALSRAVANLSTLCEYALPFVKEGGMFLSYKSADIDEELKEGQKAITTLGGEMKNVMNMVLPESGIARKIAIIDKKRKTPEKYPRQAGTPSKKPIR